MSGTNVTSLIKNGANVNIKGKKGFTPLHFAARSSQFWLAKENTLTLIKNGADVNAQSDEDGTPLHQAVSKKNNEIVKILIANGADVDAKDKLNQTPFHLALFNYSNKEGRIITEILTNSQANVNVLANEGGYSPLHGAITMGNEYCSMGIHG